jgi:hypothetical protein
VLLALASRAFGDRFLPAAWQSNVEALVDALQSRPVLALPSLALFALGPVPSNHLFIAAGIAQAPLPPILAVFGVARCVGYLLWVSAAAIADQSLRDLLGPRLGGWSVIAVQVVGFILIVLAMRVDWRRLLRGDCPSELDELTTSLVSKAELTKLRRRQSAVVRRVTYGHGADVGGGRGLSPTRAGKRRDHHRPGGGGAEHSSLPLEWQ